MQEEETMDYQSMKRKQLQTLCKKHGVPANLSNREMADRLSSILKVNKKLTSRGESLLKFSSKKVNTNDSKAKTKVVKKVRFSPENQTFFYEVSGHKRDGRRRCTLKPVPKKQIQATESVVFSPSLVGRKRARIDAKKQSLEVRNSAEDNVVEMGEENVIGGLIRRQLRNREVVVGGTHEDLVISRKKVTRGGSKMVRNEVPEENVTDSKDAKPEKISKISGRITRSHAQFESRDSENEKDEGDCEKAPRFEEPFKGVGREALMPKSDEADKVLRKRKGVTDDEGCKMVSRNSRKVESVYRITKSRTKTAGEASAAESKNEEETVQPVEPSKGVGRNALMRKSAEANKVLRKGKQDVTKDEGSEMSNGNSRKVGLVNRITRSRLKTARKICAAESKSEEEIVQPEEFSKGLGKNILRRNSVVPNTGKVGRNEVRVKKESRKRSRNVDLDGAPELEAILDTRKESEMVKDTSSPSSHSRRTRRNTAMFISTDSTSGELESHKNVGQKKSYVTKIIPRRSRRNVADIVTDSAQAEKVRQKKETNVIKDQASKNLSENPRKFKSVDRIIKSQTKADGKASTAQSESEKKIVQLEEPIVSNVISLKITNSVVGFSPADQVYYSGEPLNMVDFQKIHETEDQSVSKNINHRSDNMDDHSNKDDRTSAQEYQNLVKLEDIKENSAKPLVLEAFFKEPLTDLSRNSSKKKYEIPEVITEEINMIDPSNVKGVSPAESFLDAIEMQELITESHLVATEIGTEKTTEIQLSTAGGNVTEATMCKPTLESEAFDNKVNNSYVQSLSASNDAMKEEKNKAVDQNVVQSIGLERHNANVVGHDKLSGKRRQFFYKTISKCETFFGNARIGICNQANSEDNETINTIEPEEAFYNQRASQIVGEKIINEGYERNLLVGGSAIPIPVKTDGKGDKKKENEVSERYTQDAMETESEFSEQNLNNVSKETSGRCMHELSDAKGINMIIMEETGIDAVHGTVDKGSFPYEPALLKNHGEHVHDGSPVAITSDSSKKISTCKDNLLVHSDVQETLKSKVHEDVKEGLEVEVQEETLLQFASGELRDGLVGDITYANSISGKVLCQLIGNYNSVNKTEEQVRADIFCKEFQLDESNAARSSELVLEMVYDGANLVGEANSSVDLTVEDVHFNEDYAASKGIDDKGFKGESDVEHCADVAKEEVPNCALKAELGDKSDHEVVAPQESGSTVTRLREFIFKESEVSDEKDVETMIKSTECIERVDNLTVKGSKSENRNFHTEGNDVSALAQVTGNHLVEGETTEAYDGSVQNNRIVADEETHTVSVDKRESLKESENVETSLPVSPEIPKKSTDELAEDNDSTPDVLNGVIHVNDEDLEESSNTVVGFLLPEDEAKFGDLDKYNKQNVLELERSTSVVSDNHKSMGDTAACRKENVGIIAGDLNSNDNSSDAEKEDNVDSIPEITRKDIYDYLPKVKLCNANDSVHRVFLNYDSQNIGIAADDSDGKVGFENIEAGTRWLVKTPTFSQATKSERNHGEKNSSEGRFFADTSFYEPEIGSANEAVDTDSPFKIDDQVTKKTTSTDQKDNELLNDAVHGLNIEDNARTAEKQRDDQKGTVISIGFTDGIFCSTSNKLLCSNTRSITEVAGEETGSNKLCDTVATKNIEELHVVSSLTPRMSADLSAFSPSIDYSKYESKSLEFGIDSPQLTSWKMNMILGSGDQVDVKKSAGGILEANSTTRDCEDAVQVKEYLRNNHLTVSDEPICDKEPNQQNELSAISQEYIYYEIPKDKSNVSPEVMLLENVAFKGSNIADLDEFEEEYVADDLKEADNIAVGPCVFNCSGSRGNSIDKEVHTEATKKMNVQEVENAGTILPVTPQELSVDCGNTRETSNGISGTILQQIFRSGSGCKDKFCVKMPEYDVHSQDCSNDAGRKEMADEDKDNSYRDMALLFQEDNEATIENTEAADSFSLEHIVSDQLNESEAAANEAIFENCIYSLSLNQPSCGNKGKRHVIETEEADELHHLDDKFATTSDFNKVVDFENLIVASSLIPEMAVDCSAVSPLSATSNYENKDLELNAESYIFTSREMKLFLGSRGQDETKSSDAEDSGANMISKDAKDVKENVMIVKQVDAQSIEQQLSEQKTTVEVSKLNAALHSDLEEPTCNCSKGSTTHKNMLAIIHGTPDNKNHKKEPLKFENTNLAASRATAGEDAWKLELKLLSPQRSPEAKTRGNTLFAKKLNSSMRKQNKTLIQRTPKQLGHDRKENFLSTKKQKIGSFTAPKSLSKRRALEDLGR